MQKELRVGGSIALSMCLKNRHLRQGRRSLLGLMRMNRDRDRSRGLSVKARIRKEKAFFEKKRPK